MSCHGRPLDCPGKHCTPNKLAFAVVLLVFLSGHQPTGAAGVDPKGALVTTLAGWKENLEASNGNGTAARFKSPRGIAALPNGD